MYLARLPDGSKVIQIYRLTAKEMHPKALMAHSHPNVTTLRNRPRRAWRYDAQKMNPHTLIHSRGLAAIDDTAEEAELRLKVLAIEEKYGSAA